MTAKLKRLLGRIAAPTLAAAGTLALSGSSFGQDSSAPRAEKPSNPPAASAKDTEKANPTPEALGNAEKANAEKAKAAPQDADQPSKGSAPEPRESAKDTPAKSGEKSGSKSRDAETSRDDRPATKSSSKTEGTREQDSDREPSAKSSSKSRESREADSRDRQPARTTARASSSTNVNADIDVNNIRPADLGLWIKSSNDALVISDLESSGPIAKVGFREGDRIVSVNGERVRSQRDFITYVFAEDVRRERVKVIVLRDDREEVVYIEPIVFIEEMQVVENDPLEEFGIIVDDRYDDQIVVWKVIPKSPAYYSGIRAGDVIVIFDGQDVSAPTQLVTLAQKVDANNISVTVRRDRKEREIDLDLAEVRGEARSEAREERADERREVREERRETREESREDRGAIEVRPERAPATPSGNAPRPSAEPQRAGTPNSGNNPQRGVLPRPFNR